MSELV